MFFSRSALGEKDKTNLIKVYSKRASSKRTRQSFNGSFDECSTTI